jgi:hypothetical protein
MTQLSNEHKLLIEDFIKNNKSSKYFPVVSPQKIKVKNMFDKFIHSENDFEQYGSEGFSYSNYFYKHSNGRIYIITLNMGEIYSYNKFNESNFYNL